MTECAQRIAKPTTAPVVRVSLGGENLAEWRWEALFDAWWSVTHAMQKRRDNPANADAEREVARAFNAPGLKPKLSFDLNEDVAAPFISTGARPRVAVLREQGVNGQIEMANAFERAGFRAFDVHMSDLIEGRVACRISPAWWPVVASAMATCSVPAVAGPPRSWSAAHCVMPSPRSSRAKTASRWAYATAAR